MPMIVEWVGFVISSDRAGWPICMTCSINSHLFSKEIMVLKRRIVKHGVSIGFFQIWSCFRFSSYIIISRFVQPSFLAGSWLGTAKR